MKKFKFVVSLTNDDNDYQMEQASSAEEAARRLGVELQIICADNDAIVQSQQLLKIIQSTSTAHPDGIIFEPVGGTGLPQVARAAAIAGIGWVVLNRDVDYINDLRKTYRVPIFAITSNHEEIGRIEGRQFAALLPKGGNVLYITGPSESLAAKQRTAGMYETKPANVQVKLIKANWTETSAHKAVTSWLKLSTSQQTVVDLVASQDDGMAIGSRKAFQELPDETLRNRWLALPYIGCDGMPKTGQAWVKRGLLAATIINPANAGKALDMLIHALQIGNMPPDRTMTVPLSFPVLDALAAAHAEKVRIMSA
ncbi:MAG: monosaccharide transporter substrate-binding protein family [Acidobacteriaceae bacterium]|nr:monosaccharide transporter substrate-binding protein family [Acidobacteriaceae bacterium]